LTSQPKHAVPNETASFPVILRLKKDSTQAQKQKSNSKQALQKGRGIEEELQRAFSG
jgi:hypothetical protein